MRRQHIRTFGFGMMAGIALSLMAHAGEGMAAASYTTYRSDQPQLPVSFEYPADWEIERSSGSTEVYTQVQIYAPESLEDRLRTYMVVRAVPLQAQGGRYAGITEMVDAYRNTLMPTMRIDAERDVQVLESPARLLEVTGTLRLPWKSPVGEEVPVQSQRLFFEHGGLLYELSWLATPDVSAEVQALFAHLLDTLAPND